MKTPFRNASIAFAFGVVASAFAISWVLHRSPSLIRCRTGDLAASVVDGGGQLLTLTDESITLYDPATKRVLVSVEHSRSGAHRLSYSAYDTSQAAWVESTVGPDGKIDLRTTEISGSSAKTEFRLGER